MKNAYFAFVIMAAVFLLGCEESVEPAMSDAEAEQHALDKIDKNEGISYDLFGVHGERISNDSIGRLKILSKAKGEFIDLLTYQTEDYFPEVVNTNQADFKISFIPMPFAGEAEITLKAFASRTQPSAPPFLDHVGDYSQEILEILQAQAALGQKEWMLFSSLDDGTVQPRQLPMESISLNFTKVEMLATKPHTVIMDPNLTDEEVLEALNEMMITHEIPPVAIAMLLPAVQKVREAAATSSEPFGDAMVDWLGGTTALTGDHGLDRDIIRRIKSSAFLAGLHTLLLQQYPDENQDMASLSILHARYRASLIMTYEELWGD